MPIYIVKGLATVEVFTEVEAADENAAIEIAQEREVEIVNYNDVDMQLGYVLVHPNTPNRRWVVTGLRDCYVSMIEAEDGGELVRPGDAP